MNLRVDALFAAPGLLLILLWWGDRRLAACGVFLVGLLPGLAISAWINWVKFGSAAPITYGGSGGNTDVSSYVPLMLAAIPVALLALALANDRLRAVVVRPVPVALGLVAVIALLLVLPPLQEMLIRIVSGLYVLTVHQEAVSSAHAGVQINDNGVLTIFGVVKKSLFQSLPWAAVLILLLPRIVRGPQRAPILMCLAFAVLFVLPFALKSWHGGMSNTQRYLLPVLPALACLGAAAIAGLARRDTGPSAMRSAVMLVLLASLIAAPILMGHGIAFTFNRFAPNWLLIIGAVLAVLALILPASGRSVAVSVFSGCLITALIVAAVSGWFVDQFASQFRRHNNHLGAIAVSRVPDNALLVVLTAEPLGQILNRPPLQTLHAFRRKQENPELRPMLAQAAAANRPIYVQSEDLARSIGVLDPAGSIIVSELEPLYNLYRLSSLNPALTGTTDQ